MMRGRREHAYVPASSFRYQVIKFSFIILNDRCELNDQPNVFVVTLK